MTAFVLNLSKNHWSEATLGERESLLLKGTAYLDDRQINAKQLASLLAPHETAVSLGTALSRLNGFYAWVSNSNNLLCAGVDHIRSRPLFYGVANDRLFLSDDAEWLRQQVGEWQMDPIAQEEFQLTGYVTGPDTLFPKVKQLQAGECFVARLQEGKIRVENCRYFRFLHTEPASYNENDLREKLDQVATNCIRRLINHANGRQIVVPLSGGYDSRLIVTLLKRLGYDNILTFTYGALGNKESAYSKRVADALNLRWHFVEYSENSWREVWNTAERFAYQQWATAWNSLSINQDWLAIKRMNEHRLLEPKAVFVPGHAGDFVSGSHIPSKVLETRTFHLDDAVEAVFRRHYGLAPVKFLYTDRSRWDERIRIRMERDAIGTAWEYADVVEKWDWQERQAKYICNSVRAYEFFGHDWWLPLWDVDFVKLWESVPLKARVSQFLYIKYVKHKFFEEASSDDQICLGNAELHVSFLGRMARVVRPVLSTLGLLSPAKFFYRRFGRRIPLRQQSHFLLSALEQTELEFLETNKFSVIGGFARFSLNEHIRSFLVSGGTFSE